MDPKPVCNGTNTGFGKWDQRFAINHDLKQTIFHVYSQIQIQQNELQLPRAVTDTAGYC